MNKAKITSIKELKDLRFKNANDVLDFFKKHGIGNENFNLNPQEKYIYNLAGDSITYLDHNKNLALTHIAMASICNGKIVSAEETINFFHNQK